MTNPISQAAVDAAKAALLNEGCLDREHYPGYRDAVVTIALEAAMPHLRKQIAKEIHAMPVDHFGTFRKRDPYAVRDRAARIAEKGTEK